jgi:L-Lysine epsilon oxidase N-terminal
MVRCGVNPFNYENVPRPQNHSRGYFILPSGSPDLGSANEYFIGPEVPNASTLPTGKYKDEGGALKREVARFRIYGYNTAGQVVAEVTPDNVSIEWTVRLANKKAAWYEFQVALDIPGANAITAVPSWRRNPQVIGPDRLKLIIDPGPRSIHGRSTQGDSYRFDNGNFSN